MSDLDDYLIRRVEQAVLGSLLAGTDPAQAGPLRAKGFADPVHQAIFAAFTQPSRSWTSRLRDQAARITSRGTQDAVDYIAGLPGLCPDAANLAIYAGMHREARPGHQAPGAEQPGQSSRQEPRPAAGPGQQLEGASLWLSAAATGRGTRTGSGQAKARTGELLDPRTERLSRAIRAAIRSGRLREARRSRAREASVAVAGPAQASDGNATASLRKEDLQDAVLADLMRHPADGRDLVQRVPLNAFTRGPRQDLYRLIAWPIAHGKPVDWLITAWQARKQEASRQDAPAAAGPAAAESLTAIAVRVGAMRPLRGTAGVIGRALLGDYEVSMAFGPDWTRQRELNWAAAQMPAAVGHQASHEPSVGPWSASPGKGAPAQRAAQPQPDPPAPRHATGQSRVVRPTERYGHGSQPGGPVPHGHGPVPQPMAPAPPWGNAGWQQGPVQQG
jgi:hypothetical protein